MSFYWATTVASGKAHTHGADDGVVGWKLHLIDSDKTVDREVRTRYGFYKTPHGPALCGLRAKYGWGRDLFIDDFCARCFARAVKLGITIPKD